ncbi:alpha-amylase family glycosyl hydrolase [Cohnella massiliensis]|uniref:alpha-amylase family glycosyl hydrolase n=1 Tax=Cohnella massiliensis TaxID=1816691 RepID=UPI0009BBDA5F|nr:alpha-amylase family glycosyl hydrolase [Cohnella massiliensis]
MRRAAVWLILIGLLAGCTGGGGDASPPAAVSAPASGEAAAPGSDSAGTGAGPAESASPSPASPSPASSLAPAAGWEADEQPSAVYYEIFVRSFYDSDGDGIGDLNGVAEKLDYLGELGVGGIWLMPINASPSYHGYDVTDYYAVHPDYGTLEDFRHLLEAAHARGIKVIMDFVVNHTSSEHPWFKEALADPDSPYRSWYTIRPSAEKTPSDNAASSGSPWHDAGNEKYLGIFWGGMPDLNFDEPAVREEMIEIGRFWLEQGVDGFRLDAAKHIYGDFASTVHSEEVAAKNKAWWQEFRKGLRETNPDAYLVGEIWDSTSMIAPLLDRALDSGFNFDLAGRILDAAQGERDPDVAFGLKRVYGAYGKASGGAFTDAVFLANHDQNRVMSVLGGNADRARMAAAVLLTLPGNPFLYYGEEIGMLGMKPDEAIREPMLWYEGAEGGPGQTSWQTPRYSKPGTVSVEAQERDERSLLRHYRTLIGWRNELPELRDGDIDEYKTGNPKLGAFIRKTGDSRVLVVHNMSGEPQEAELAPSGLYGSFQKIERQTGGETDAAALDGTTLRLAPYSSVVIR